MAGISDFCGGILREYQQLPEGSDDCGRPLTDRTHGWSAVDHPNFQIHIRKLRGYLEYCKSHTGSEECQHLAEPVRFTIHKLFSEQHSWNILSVLWKHHLQSNDFSSDILLKPVILIHFA